MNTLVLRSTMLIGLAGLIVLSTLKPAFAADQVTRPNILLILTDDQGWPTLGCYGNRRVETPNLDRVAADGIRFTDAYVMPQCTPTRAALLTGQHTAVNRMWHVIGWYGTPWGRIQEPLFRENLRPKDCRLPRLLRRSGYVTGMAGKWHLTNNEDGFYTYLRQAAAEKYGFDEVAPPGPGSQNEGDKWVDHLTDYAIEFIKRHRQRPWFFYLSHHTLHGKVSAPLRLIEKYSLAGAPATGMHNATYLAAIEHLDHSVGRLMNELDRLDQSENTIVVFLGDNGGVDTSYQLPQWHDSPTDGSVPLRVREQQFDNDPLREGKGSVYEGGIRVPCLVRWPSIIEGGQINSTPIHVVDWLPTLLSAAGVPIDVVTDGIDLTSLFQGQMPAERSLYWYMPLYDLRWASTPAAVLRKGDWKLIHFFGDRFDRDGRYRPGAKSELFNLSDDIGEANDQSGQHPQRVAEMKRELIEWIRSTGAAVPGKNPYFDGQRALLETKKKPDWLSQ